MKRVFRLPASARRLRDEVDAELLFHIQGRVEDFMAQGMSREEAEAEARKRFGNYDGYRSEAQHIDARIVRERGRAEFFEMLWREARYAFRALRRTPTFSIIAALTIAIGIGAPAAMFTVLDRVVLRPLPYADADRLVRLESRVPGLGADETWAIGRGQLAYLQQNTKSFESLGIYQSLGVVVTLPDASTRRLTAATVSAGLQSVLRSRVVLGRAIVDDDNRERTPRVALLGYRLWQREFGGDERVVGRAIDIDGAPTTIIGVLADDARIPDELMSREYAADLWLPVYYNPSDAARNNHVLRGVGRLRAGVTVEAADAEVARLTADFPRAMPTAYDDAFMRRTRFRTSVIPLQEYVLGGVGSTIWILFASVAVVLLIAAVNVTNLFLVRAEGRRRDLAVRTALGADRGHLSAHYLAESLLIVAAGGVLAIVMAHVALRVMLWNAPDGLPRASEIHVGWSTVAFVVALVLLLTIAFAMISLFRIGKRTTFAALREGGRGGTARRARVRAVLIATQSALALVLLASAGLLLRSFQKLHAVRGGFATSGVLTATMLVPAARYDGDALTSFLERLAERARTLPGVVSVGVGDREALPLSGEGCTAVYAPEHVPQPGEQPFCPAVQEVADGFFNALLIDVRGRTQTWSDLHTPATAGVVVTPELARRLWPGQDPIGKQIGTSRVKLTLRTVIGVTGELRFGGLDQPPSVIAFFPMVPSAETQGRRAANATLIIRSASESQLPSSEAVRRLVAELDPAVPLASVETMRERVAASTARVSFAMVLIGLAAAMALTLSVIGIYGAISYLVGQRRNEIGIRVALGANARQVASMVMMHALRIAALGIVVGVAASLLVTRLLQSMLFEVSPSDPIVLGAVSLMIALLAALASAGPARRAARVDPAEALRAE